MRDIPKFGILSNGELSGKVISLERPYIIASVHTYKRDDEKVEDRMEDMVQGRYPIAKVKGYAVFLTMYTSLEPNNNREFQQAVLNEMAQFFLEEKIKAKPGLFMKSEESGKNERRIVAEGHRRQRMKRD